MHDFFGNSEVEELIGFPLIHLSSIPPSAKGYKTPARYGAGAKKYGLPI